MDMFDKIKKQNGERFAKSIRNYDNGIFDIPNIDQIVKYAGKEAEPIINYLISLKNIQIEEHGVYQSPIELLAKAGYKAYYADTLQKQNYISRYFAPGEALCTFRDRKRYQNYYIINAIKENVDEIKREDFKNPQREDEYGTSVISIQIAKKGGFISIKNRYNHTVPNPDNTFNSNPDNIIKGLSESLKHTFNVDFSSQKVRIPDNFMICGQQIVHYNYEVENTYFSEKCYVKDGKIHEIDTQKELMLDYFVLNLHDKSIQNPSGIEDGFIAALTNELKGKKIQVVVNESKNKCLLANGVQILELNKGKIINLNLPEVQTLGNDFLFRNTELQSFIAPNVKKIENRFIFWGKNLKELILPEAIKIGNGFLYNNQHLERFYAPKVQIIGEQSLFNNQKLSEVKLPEVVKVGNYFLQDNASLKYISLPKVETIGSYFLYNNRNLKRLDLPEVRDLGGNFLYNNQSLEHITAPKAEKIGFGFLSNNENLKRLELPEVRDLEDDFLYNNAVLEQISVPKVENIGIHFLYYNIDLKKLELPAVRVIGSRFLSLNRVLESFTAPNLKVIGNDFLKQNLKLAKFDLPQLVKLGYDCLSANTDLETLNLPALKKINKSFLRVHPRRKRLMVLKYFNHLKIRSLFARIHALKKRGDKSAYTSEHPAYKVPVQDSVSVLPLTKVEERE